MLPQESEARERLLRLLRERAYRKGNVTLASGKTSDFYIDCKQVTLDAEGATLVGVCLAAAIDRYEEAHGPVAAVGGLTLGADPVATAVAVVTHLRGSGRPAFIVRKESKGHGTQQFLEGVSRLPEGAELVVLEDVVTTGGSALTAVERVRAAGFRVRHVLGLVDREEGGTEALAESELTLETLFRRSDFVTP